MLQMPSYRIEKSAGAVMFIRKDPEIKYLLLNYPAGHWDFPKGRIEKGETEIETARREIKEETDISKIKIFEKFKKNIEYHYKAHGKLVEKTVTFFLAEAFNYDVKISSEHKDYKWLNYDDSLSKITYKNSSGILGMAANHIDNYIKI